MPHRQILVAVILGALPAMITPLSGAEPGTALLRNDMSPWREPLGEWRLVGEASMDPDNTRSFNTVPGRTLVINGSGQTSHLFTKGEYGDIEAHIEFMIPQGSNSGIYFQGRYEIQIVDSFGAKKPHYGLCGGIYQRWRVVDGKGEGFEGYAPKVNAARRRGEWQAFDVIFRAPRFDEQGNKIANAQFEKVVHNGILIHENREVSGPTRVSAYNDEQPAGPLMFQGDHGLVAYRNIRIRTLHDREPIKPVSALFTPELYAYEAGKDRRALAAIEERIRKGSPDEITAIEKGLIDTLQRKEATGASKEFACRMLRQIGTENAVPALAAIMADKGLAHMAVFALAGIPSSTVDEVLRDAIDSAEGDLQFALLNALADRRDRQAVPRIAARMKSDDAALVKTAMSALGRIGGVEAADVLAQVTLPQRLEESRNHARLVCAENFLAEGKTAEAIAIYGALSQRQYSTPIRIAAYEGIIRAEGPKSLPTILALLKDDDRALQLAAGKFLATIPGEGVSEAVAAEIAQLDPEVQVVVLGALATRGDKAVAPAVTAAARHQDPRVQTAALGALGALGNASHVKLLIETAQTDGSPSKAARDSLHRLSDPGVNEAILEVLGNDNAACQALAFDALNHRAVATAVRAAIVATENGDGNLRRAAIRYLARFGGQTELPRLVEMLVAPQNAAERGQLARAVAAVAGRVGDSERTGPIVAALPSANVDAKVRLLAILGSLGGDDALDAVRAELEEDNESVRGAAVRALANWPDISPLRDLLEIAKHDSDPARRRLALRAFIEKTDTPKIRRSGQGVKLFGEAMALAQEPKDKKRILAGLGKLIDTRALPVAKKYFDDPALEEAARAAYKAVAVATYQWKGEDKPQSAAAPPQTEYVLTAEAAIIVGSGAKRESHDGHAHIGSWEHVSTWLLWHVEIDVPGAFSISVTQSSAGNAGSEYLVAVEDKELPGVVQDTGDWTHFETQTLGEIEIAEPGVHTVALVPIRKAGDQMARLSKVTLRRVK